jgi:hypothetical protein
MPRPLSFLDWMTPVTSIEEKNPEAPHWLSDNWIGKTKVLTVKTVQLVNHVTLGSNSAINRLQFAPHTPCYISEAEYTVPYYII